MKTLSIILLLITISSIAKTARGSDDWSFLVIADWHGAEFFAIHRDRSKGYEAAVKVLSHIKDNYGGELVLLPGDSNGGHWYKKGFIRRLSSKYGNIPLTPNASIALAGHNCYSTIRKAFSTVGYNDVLLTIGDHEIGDNPWPKGSDVAKGLPVFRRALAKELNEVEDESGNRSFKYTDPIGNATSRPLGTIYEDTSYAYVHKNALFITIDVYHVLEENYFSRKQGQGGSGAVTGTVVGDHLKWFENVLVEADKDDSIKHKFVQAHLPVVEPVRKINSSSMAFDKGANSDFWKLMRKYGVDVYFAGEVHALTAIKDSESDLIQITSRGNRFSNFLRVGNITENSFNIEVFNEVGENWKWNANYTKYGELSVQKNLNGTTMIKDEGALKFVDVNAGPLIKFKFDELDQYPLHTRQIVGFKYENYRARLIGSSSVIRGKRSQLGLVNHGEFGHQYDAQIANLGFIDNSPTGRGQVGVFNTDTRVAIGSLGPFVGGKRFSFEVSFSTTSESHMILVSYSHAWAGPTKTDMVLLTLKDGLPTIFIDDESYIQSTKDVSLSDGGWHKIFVKMPSSSCHLSEIKIFIDGGNAVPTKLYGNDRFLFFTTTGYLSLGGFGYSKNVFGTTFFQDTTNFIGMMDTFELWMKTEEKLPPPTRNALKFKIHENRRCKPATTKLRIGQRDMSQCIAACLEDPQCKGFELRLFRIQIEKRPVCFLTTGETEPIMSRKNYGSFCGIRTSI